MTSSAVAILEEAKRRKLADIDRIEADNKDVLGRARTLLGLIEEGNSEIVELDEAIEALTHPPKKPVQRGEKPDPYLVQHDEYPAGVGTERPDVEAMNVGGVNITRRSAQ